MRTSRIRLLVVFLLSRRCNLACTYCNVEAGPNVVSPQIDLAGFEKWVDSFASLGDVDLAVQLHGGEPLIVRPAIEHYAAVARNAVAAHPTARLLGVTAVTNGLMLDEARACSLDDAGIQVNVSVDGPAELHDRYRRTLSGRGSHRDAVRALDVLSRKGHPAILSVVTRPEDVARNIEFFFDRGFMQVQLNPVRPEGRGVDFAEVANEMREMAHAYFGAAKRLAAHNAENPDQPFFEQNIHTMLTRVLEDRELADPHLPSDRPEPIDWTLAVDEKQVLWPHPAASGLGRAPLLTAGAPDRAALEQALGLEADCLPIAEDRVGRLKRSRMGTFSPCRGCQDPHWCVRFNPPVGGSTPSGQDPSCVWRETLHQLLDEWVAESPQEAMHATYTYSTEVDARGTGFEEARPRHDSRPAEDSPAARGVGASLEPVVTEILDSIRVSEGGQRHIVGYAARVQELLRMQHARQESAFVQLAHQAGAFADRGRTDVAGSLAMLARIGLEGRGA